jgi:hypothetical protein
MVNIFGVGMVNPHTSYDYPVMTAANKVNLPVREIIRLRDSGAIVACSPKTVPAGMVKVTKYKDKVTGGFHHGLLATVK